MITFRRDLEKDRTKSADEMYNKFVEVNSNIHRKTRKTLLAELDKKKEAKVRHKTLLFQRFGRSHVSFQCLRNL